MYNFIVALNILRETKTEFVLMEDLEVITNKIGTKLSFNEFNKRLFHHYALYII